MHFDIEMCELHDLHFDVLHSHERHVSISCITCRQKREVVMKNIAIYIFTLLGRQTAYTGSLVTGVSGRPMGLIFKGQIFHFGLLDS